MESVKDKTCIVVGAGASGIATAALLAKDGYSVTVIDKHPQIGGLSGQIKAKGFTFDTGPTWYLMPEVFEKFFKEFNKKPQDYYELIDLNPSYKIFFSKDEHLAITQDFEKNAAIFETFEKGITEKLKVYLKDSKYKYDTSLAEFLYKDYKNIADFFNKKIMIEGFRIDIFKKLEKYLKKYFKSEKLRRILSFNIVFLGCSPFKIPALYSLMTHVDFTLGVQFPKGGIYSVIEGIYELSKEQGVTYILNEEVTNIIVKDKIVQGVATANRTYEADLIVSSIDMHHCEINLLSLEYRTYGEKYWNKRVLAPSVLLFFIGLNKKLTNLEHHSLFLSDNWKEHFNAIFDKPAWPENPSYYVGVPSITDESFAPKKGESLFVLVPVAPGLDDSDEIREKLFNNVITHLEGLTENSIKDAIVYKEIKSQREFASMHNTFKGTALGLSHTLFQTAYFRPSHRSKKVKNLFFTGHYTHPGIGLPMVMISSHITRDVINKYYK